MGNGNAGRGGPVLPGELCTRDEEKMGDLREKSAEDQLGIIEILSFLFDLLL
jgi:hypothetical protein